LAYARACYQFFYWVRENELSLDTVRPFHVAAYIEQMPGSKPTIKQKLAALRMLYDFLVVRQLVPVNPTASVRGPKSGSPKSSGTSSPHLKAKKQQTFEAPLSQVPGGITYS
jgi:site-specific recombinase XerD